MEILFIMHTIIKRQCAVHKKMKKMWLFPKTVWEFGFYVHVKTISALLHL